MLLTQPHTKKRLRESDFLIQFRIRSEVVERARLEAFAIRSEIEARLSDGKDDQQPECETGR